MNKVVFIGPTNAGKTALLYCLEGEIFSDFSSELSPTIGASFINREGYDLWDTSGNPVFVALTKFYMRDSGLVVLVMDPQNVTSQEALPYFIASIKGETNASILLVLSHQDEWKNKQDIQTRAENLKTEFVKLCEKRKCLTLNMSAKEFEPGLLLATLKKLLNPAVPVRFFSQRLDEFVVKLKKRFFKPDASRYATIKELQKDLTHAFSKNDATNALIKAAADIRTPQNGKLKYGATLFGKHFGDYKNSGLYKLIKTELATLDPTINLEVASTPAAAVSQMSKKI